MMSNNVLRGDFMNDFVNFECACNIGYDKGALKKTIENNIFSIFGNLNQKNTIVIRYHGLLTENNNDNSTEFNMFYFFDNLENDKKNIKLHKCSKCAGECYCATIDLDMYHTLNFGFLDNKGNSELNENITFKLNISPDPISNIMQRYGFEQNTSLPTISEKKEKVFAFESIINSIKIFFKNCFKSKPYVQD